MIFFVKKTFGRWKILFRSQKFNWPKKSQLIEYSIQRSLFECRWYGTTLTSESKYVELLYFLNNNGNLLITISISILNTIKNSLLFCLLTKTLFPQKCYYLNIAGITNHFAVFFLLKSSFSSLKNVFTIKSFFTQRTFDAEISWLIVKEKKTLDMMTIFVENTFQNIDTKLLQRKIHFESDYQQVNKSPTIFKLAIIDFDVSISISTNSHFGGTTLIFFSLIWPWAAVKLTWYFIEAFDFLGLAEFQHLLKLQSIYHMIGNM